MQTAKEDKKELKKFIQATYLPLTFVAVLVGMKLLEMGLGVRFTEMGVFPKRFSGLIGVLTSPLVHADWEHLGGNSIPLLVLGTLFIYFHRSKSIEILMVLYAVSGLWLWLFGRPVYHIGASGIVYALAAYLITYGFVLRNPATLSITFLVILFYGSLIWYVLPIKEGMSWEAHLCGALTGILYAIYYAKQFKKQLTLVNGSVDYSYNTQYSDPVEFLYIYREGR